MFNTDLNGFTKWKKKEGKKRKGNVNTDLNGFTKWKKK